MPIIRRNATQISNLEYEKDNYKIEHREIIDPKVLKENYEYRKDKNNAKSESEQLGRLIARVPTLTYMAWRKQYPELRDSDPGYRDRFLFKLLEKSENEVFRTVNKI